MKNRHRIINDNGGITLYINANIPHDDHIEMSGEQQTINNK